MKNVDWRLDRRTKLKWRQERRAGQVRGENNDDGQETRREEKEN